jgi:hypothetical protein
MSYYTRAGEQRQSYTRGGRGTIARSILDESRCEELVAHIRHIHTRLFAFAVNNQLIQDRDVVLVTHDRILQLKAMHHESSVPVAEIPQFMKWIESG